jgi:hypothetical protein
MRHLDVCPNCRNYLQLQGKTTVVLQVCVDICVLFNILASSELKTHGAMYRENVYRYCPVGITQLMNLTVKTHCAMSDKTHSDMSDTYVCAMQI